MHKFFLLIIVINTFLVADYMTESDLLMEQNLEDIKQKYNIHEETPEEIEIIDSPMPKMKEELYEVPASVIIREPVKVEIVIPQMKQEISGVNESILPKNEDKLQRIRKELNIPELTGKEKKLDEIRHELKIGYEVPKRESFLDKSVVSVKERLHMDGEIDGEYSFSNSVRDLKKTLHLDGASSWDIPSFGLPSLFGEEKKKKKEKGLFGIGVLGSVQDTGKSLYKGMKYSGQSAEMMSGMMYNSSKMYNTMFGLFDDSPLNIFEDEEEETSMFDFIEGGNSIMKLFD